MSIEFLLHVSFSGRRGSVKEDGMLLDVKFELERVLRHSRYVLPLPGGSHPFSVF